MAKGILKRLLLLIISLHVPALLSAQLRIESQLRNRFEWRDGYQKLAAARSTPAVLISQRTRLTLCYETEFLNIKIASQDVRLWGDDPNISSTGTGDNATLGLFEGYAEIRLGRSVWFSAGRQQLVYDKEWIFSTRNWNQNGIAYDAAVLKMKLSDWNFHLGSTWNTLNERGSDNFYPANRIKSIHYLWLNNKIVPSFNFSLLHVASGVTKSDDENKLYFRQTSGVFAEFKKGDFSVWSNLYYQYGKNQTGKNVNAFLADYDASYRLGTSIIGNGLSILSGNNQVGTAQTNDRLFDMLYGVRHRYFGNLDYFRTFSSHTLQGGLANFYLYIDIDVTKKWNIRNTCHYFRLDQVNPLTPANKNLGFENDLIVKYKFNSWGTLESGFLFMLPTESLKTIQNVPDAKFSNFTYFQLTILPTLYKN